MRSVARYLLFLLVAVLLVLPQGWCCILMGEVRAASPLPERTDCCCCPPAPAEDEEPARPARTCCCGSRDLLLAASLEIPQVDLFLLMPAVVLLAPPTVSPGEVFGLALPPPASPRLHLLQCVWLC